MTTICARCKGTKIDPVFAAMEDHGNGDVREVPEPCADCQVPAPAPEFGTDGCTCVPWTRQGGEPRLCGPNDTVDMIGGWHFGSDCPHHAPRKPSDSDHRLALSEALGLGTGAPWDAIEERAAELTAAALTAPADRAHRRACPSREPLLDVQCAKEAGHETHSDRPGRIWYPAPAERAAVKMGATITRLRAERAELNRQLACIRGDMRDMEAHLREQDAEFERLRGGRAAVLADAEELAELDREGAELVCVDTCGSCDACGMEPFGTPAEGWREAARFLRRTDRDSPDFLGAIRGARLIETELRRRADEAQQTKPDADDLTAEENRDLADDLGLQLYRAQDALAFVAECCDIADREQRPVTTGVVREWLKGARCGRELRADEAQQGEAERPVQHAPGIAIRCPACRSKGYSVCLAEGAQR
ncbi:MAG TPA: hypothetical protein VK698_39505 [Kofleriaceae bacterium]|nr:hypothetical protein [Kofleriaceae bacterium]